MSQVWRDLTNNERQLIELLLTKDFPGAEALRGQLETAKASAIDAEGSLQFRVSGPLADVHHRVPTEGYYFDTKGVDFRPAVNVLLLSSRVGSMSWRCTRMMAQQLRRHWMHWMRLPSPVRALTRDVPVVTSPQ